MGLAYELPLVASHFGMKKEDRREVWPGMCRDKPFEIVACILRLVVLFEAVVEECCLGDAKPGR